MAALLSRCRLEERSVVGPLRSDRVRGAEAKSEIKRQLEAVGDWQERSLVDSNLTRRHAPQAVALDLLLEPIAEEAEDGRIRRATRLLAYKRPPRPDGVEPNRQFIQIVLDGGAGVLYRCRATKTAIQGQPFLHLAETGRIRRAHQLVTK